ncbi:MAG: hypothetical protein OXT64_06650 [Gammaproteobacteria bacterium]|nr:hypothetical protein [Gammaproteobacteria bacterium]
MFDPIGTRINLALAAMNAPPPGDTPELDRLFARLGAGGNDREETERRIWTIWCSHESDAAARAMHAAIVAIEASDFASAGKTLDRMVRRWPDWAEAWNKRATLRFLEERDPDSLSDIIHTLEREPRHFGALSGFGQICLRHGDMHSAVLAFERVLELNPYASELRQTVEKMQKRVKRTVH